MCVCVCVCVRAGGGGGGGAKLTISNSSLYDSIRYFTTLSAGYKFKCTCLTYGISCNRMYLWCLCTLYLHGCQVRFTVGDSGLCCLLVLRILSAN